MKETFFTHDKNFYRNLFSMLVIVALQNVIAYSVNMADNIMLRSGGSPGSCFGIRSLPAWD